MPSQLPQVNIRATPETVAALHQLCADWRASQGEVVAAVLAVAAHRWATLGAIPTVFKDRLSEPASRTPRCSG